MKVSVVIPNFNDLRIQRAITSVQGQANAEYELVIVDGGSSDQRLLQYYETCGADRLVIERDGGIFDALNKGIALATGEVIYLMGSDDYLSDDSVFADVRRAFDDDPSLDGLCIGCEFVDARGRVIRRWFPKRVSATRMKRGLLPPHFSLFLRRELYSLVGEFEYRQLNNVACDTLWLLDLAIAKPDLRVRTMRNHHLNMEYGGASTRGLSTVLRQFRVVHQFARSRSRHLTQWYLFSALRTLSKVTQFRLSRG
jgi:glycosyltransferase